MKLRRTIYFMLGALLAIAVTGLTANAQQAHIAKSNSQDLNLSDAQVNKIQALLLTQNTELRTLYANVQSAQETLTAAVAKGDPVLTAMAVLSLDAAEKALRNVQAANERSVMSLLSDSQKQIVKDYSHKSIPASD
jgi:hypothetical protein